jgi:hypothetical protein
MSEIVFETFSSVLSTYKLILSYFSTIYIYIYIYINMKLSSTCSMKPLATKHSFPSSSLRVPMFSSVDTVFPYHTLTELLMCLALHCTFRRRSYMYDNKPGAIEKASAYFPGDLGLFLGTDARFNGSSPVRQSAQPGHHDRRTTDELWPFDWTAASRARVPEADFPAANSLRQYEYSCGR